MEDQLIQFIETLPWYFLFPGILGVLLVLGWAADMLVDEAVVLSERAQIPKIVIGATIVSLGTTTPEAAVSVFAAWEGDPSLALGNAVGSILCDTGLILGIACLIQPIPLPKTIVNRQGWLQLASGILLVICCWPWSSSISDVFSGAVTGNMSQKIGFAFLVLLGLYLWISAVWASHEKNLNQDLEEFEEDQAAPLWKILVKLVFAVVVVVASSKVLIPMVSTAAENVGIPQAVIAASLVAFGTSLPELVTAVTASRRGHGELALGNIVGADILNVLFVTGAAAAVTPAGLEAGPHFFRYLFPAMLIVLLVFRAALLINKQNLGRVFGVGMILIYVIAMLVTTLLREI